MDRRDVADHEHLIEDAVQARETARETVAQAEEAVARARATCDRLAAERSAFRNEPSE